jgi:hypothetical protein
MNSQADFLNSAFTGPVARKQRRAAHQLYQMPSERRREHQEPVQVQKMWAAL